LILFLLALVWVVWVLFGYGILLGILANRKHVEPVEGFEPRSVTVLLAVHNGERWLRDKLNSLLALEYPAELLRVLVISDGSTDATVTIAQEFASRGVECLLVPKGGKALALSAGLERAKGEILFFTDVRQPLDPGSLRELVSYFADPTVGVVSGELIIREGDSLAEANVGRYWTYEKSIRIRLSKIDSVLGATGCIYAMRRSLAKPLPAGCLLDDMYLPLHAFFQGYRVLFDSKARAYDLPTSLDSEFRRKVRTLAGVYQIIGYYPALLGPKNRMWIHFVSHKFGRLLVPFALLIMIFTAPFLPWPLNVLMMSGQAFFYGLALVDVDLSEKNSLKKITSPIRTFVVLMAASLAATSILFRPGDSFWKPTR
jgi:cellulose synthase/poly-beta-1,6-N-acetylglucosamine synthase-like glycosyltransferase